MKKILITGSDGFLGNHLISYFEENDLNYIAISRKKTKKNVIKCNLLNFTKLLKILNNEKPNVIINLAATVDFRGNCIDKFFPINVLLVSILSNYCKINNAHLIQTSGIIVHGFSHELYNIKTSLVPDSNYGKSKLLAEENIIQSNPKYTILRIGGIYGLNGPSHLGLNIAIKNAIKGKVPEVIGDGSIKRNYIYVVDVCRAIVNAFQNNIEGIKYLGGEIKTIKSMMKDILQVLLPERNEIYLDGARGRDQIIENSKFYKVTPFRKSIEELKCE